MDFFEDTFEIAPENQMWVIRINDGNGSPSKIGTWNLEAKSVEENNGIGIYGVPALNLSIGFDLFFRMFLSTIKQQEDLRFLLLEIDKSDIMFLNPFEVSFSRCNIKKVFNKETFMFFCQGFVGFKYMQECFDDSKNAVDIFKCEDYYGWLEYMKKSMHKMFVRIQSLRIVNEYYLYMLEKQYIDKLDKTCNELISNYHSNLLNK